MHNEKVMQQTIIVLLILLVLVNLALAHSMQKARKFEQAYSKMVVSERVWKRTAEDLIDITEIQKETISEQDRQIELQQELIRELQK